MKHLSNCQHFQLFASEVIPKVEPDKFCIEANPTSNFLIGTFRRYDAHPITRLFNLGLTYDPADLAACPQLNVSINTDDLGIFDTSLENEYALMATALQKAKTPDGQPRYKHALIMDWLDRVRLNGLSQSFLLREGGRAYPPHG